MSFLRNLRQSGIQFAIEYIKEEDKQTNYVDIGPVNKALNMLCVWVDGGRDSLNVDFRKHLVRVDDYLWLAEDGLKMQGRLGGAGDESEFHATI